MLQMSKCKCCRDICILMLPDAKATFPGKFSPNSPIVMESARCKLRVARYNLLINVANFPRCQIQDILLVANIANVAIIYMNDK